MLAVGFLSGAGLRASLASPCAVDFEAIRTYPDILGRGSCLGDFDGDGAPDVARVIASQPRTMELWRAKAGGWLELTTVEALLVAGSGAAAGDFDGDGNLDVAIASGLPSPALEVLLGQGNGAFVHLHPVAVPLSSALTAGDLDGDSDDDLVGSGDGLTVWLSNGNGTFARPATYEAVTTFYACTLATLDAGTSPDIVATIAWQQEVGVLRNNGDGTFQPMTRFAGGNEFGASGVADIDEDGNLDVVTASGPSILLGNGDGTLQAPYTVAPSTGTFLVAAGDVGGDGHQDLLELGITNSVQLCVRRGRGDGTFELPFCERIGGSGYSSLWWIAAVDVDGDGISDVVAETEEALLIAMGRTGGTFPVPLHVSQPGFPLAVGAGDWNADDIPDLASCLPGPVHIAYGLPTGGFTPATPAVNTAGTALGVADFDVDGRTDLAVVGSGTIELHLNDGAGGFRPTATVPVYQARGSMAMGDVNGDGLPDLLAGDAVVPVRPGGRFGVPILLPIANQPRGHALADFNGDGFLDAVVTDAGLDVAQVLLGDGNGGFFLRTAPAVGAAPHDVEALDLDEDGKQDLVTANSRDDTVSILLGNGDGTFRAASTIEGGVTPHTLASADVDGDRHADLLVMHDFVMPFRNGSILAAGTSGVRVLLGDGMGNLGHEGGLLIREPWDIALADFDRNGTPDVAATSGMLYYEELVVAGNTSLGIAPADLPTAAVGVPYLQTFSGTGGSGPFAFSLAGGTLPPGLSLSPAGSLSGTPSTAGRFRFVVRVTDAGGCSRTAARELRVLGCAPIGVSPPSLPAGFTGIPYAATITATGGVAPYSYALTSGFLPVGLSLDRATGAVSGTPTDSVAETFTVTASDVNGCSGSHSYSVTVTCPAISLAPSTLPRGNVGSAYSLTVTASGGTAPYTFAVTAGTPPPGVSLSSSGVLSGAPQVAGTFSFTATATDAFACAGTRSYTMDVDPPCSIAIGPPSLPPASEGAAYDQTLTATGGTAPYTWTITAGALPPGLALAPGTGVIAGTPSQNGTYGFTATATDASFSACAGSRAYMLTVDVAVDHVLGEGLGPTNGNGVRVYKRNGTPASTSFNAYGSGQWGTNVASGELNGATYGEILTAPGPGDVYGPHVRGWLRDGTSVAKVSFYAYSTLKYGANVGAGRLDADGFDEILTGPGPGEVFGPHVRAFDFDNATLAAIAKVNFFAYGTLKYGVNVEEGSVDADAFAEILTGAGPGSVFAATVKGFNYDGASLSAIAKINFNAFPTSFGVNVAGGDADGDGFAEIATAQGPAPGNANAFAGFDYDGTAIAPAPGFTVTPSPASLYGGRVGTGDVTGDGRAELQCGAGRDPAAGSTVNVYRYTGAALVAVPPAFAPFTAAGYAYGVNVAGGGLGYF